MIKINVVVLPFKDFGFYKNDQFISAMTFLTTKPMQYLFTMPNFELHVFMMCVILSVCWGFFYWPQSVQNSSEDTVS